MAIEIFNFHQFFILISWENYILRNINFSHQNSLFSLHYGRDRRTNWFRESLSNIQKILLKIWNLSYLVPSKINHIFSLSYGRSERYWDIFNYGYFLFKYFSITSFSMFNTNMLPQNWFFRESFSTFLTFKLLDIVQLFVAPHNLPSHIKLAAYITSWSDLVNIPVMFIISLIVSKLYITNITHKIFLSDHFIVFFIVNSIIYNNILKSKFFLN